jgi:NADP-dependent aldehyde dehydrogenase
VISATVQGWDPRTGETVGAPVPDTTVGELDVVLSTAESATTTLRRTTPNQRAGWLRSAADALDDARGDLVPLAASETGLPIGRLKGEVARTSGQLRLFAEVLDEGSFLEATIDHADPEARPAPRPDVRRVLEPLGPVLVFAASNFPFAFSVAGGDTASALAAGCSVVVKAHPGHPGLSVLVGDVLLKALLAAGAPRGVLAVVHGMETGVLALRDTRIRACGFTGSLSGGRALFDIACGREQPIPFYGELGSLNPVVVTDDAVRRRGEEIVAGFVDSFTLGTGQFCTKPGLLLLPRGHGLEDALREAVASLDAAPMLNARMHTAFRTGVNALAARPGVRPLVPPTASDRPGAWASPALLLVGAAAVLEARDPLLQECFGPVSMVVEYDGRDQLASVLREVGGSLTASLHAEDDEDVHSLVDLMRTTAGRVVWNGWPTGVAVTWSMHHGGPYPATTDPLHTSVGATAIRRFLRPAAYQSLPQHLLPPALQDDNPLAIPRRVDGSLVLPAS